MVWGWVGFPGGGGEADLDEAVVGAGEEAVAAGGEEEDVQRGAVAEQALAGPQGGEEVGATGDGVPRGIPRPQPNVIHSDLTKKHSLSYSGI